jgi:cytochrome c
VAQGDVDYGQRLPPSAHPLIQINNGIRIRERNGRSARIIVAQARTRRGKGMKAALKLFAFCAAATMLPAHAQVDVSAAEGLMKKSGCLKCHSVSAKKEGPPFKETAAKYKGKADAEKTLTTHLTTNPKVKVDGKEELHDSLKTKNPADVQNVVRYILSR